MYDASKLSVPKDCRIGKKINIGGIPLTLAEPDTHESHWIDYNDGESKKLNNV